MLWDLVFAALLITFASWLFCYLRACWKQDLWDFHQIVPPMFIVVVMVGMIVATWYSYHHPGWDRF